jgi:RNA polymerase-associated protein CTR9
MADYGTHANGVNGHDSMYHNSRFADIPRAITVAVAEQDGPIDVEISLDDDIQDDPTELCTLLDNENAEKSMWIVVALGYAKQKKLDVALEVLSKALTALSAGQANDRLSILNAICWLYLLKCREAPRIKGEGHLGSDVRTKDFYIQAATSVLNDASRISPSYPPLFLARGVLYLLRASLQPPSAPGPTSHIGSERFDMLKQAAKCFEDALRSSGGKNMMAMMGKARVNYSLGKYPEALKAYQTVLERAPDLIDPDPRIGIGCCYWQLGHKDDAATAWNRSLELNPNSKIGLVLIGIYNLHRSSQYPTGDPNFTELYKKAMLHYTVPAFKVDDKYPLTCATLGGYYLMRRGMDKVESLARRAIELTDVNAVASDGWYLLARKEHYGEEISKANDFYARADQARGGDEKGYIPAKFGAAQMRVMMQDFDGAKFRLEKILQQAPVLEAHTLLGTLYAEDVFSAQATKSKEDKSAEWKKAVQHLEQVSKAWRDPKKNMTPDSTVLLNLARLYETDQPEKSLKCLEEVEQMELKEIPEADRPQDIEDETLLKGALREFLPPQLLNNMACFHYQAERYGQARDLFQTALNACVKAGDRDPTIDTDALVTSISFNLARTYEAEGMLDEAKNVYEGLLGRHSDYTDAQIRLAYIALRQHPMDEGPKALSKLYQAHPTNLEVRALHGWWVNKSKKRTQNVAEDQEQRHYKHTLQNFDKHDRYALTGMGNIWLAIAREMRRDTEQDKEKRRKMYEKAVEFFDKALQLDPRNAYAAQGIAIALVEDKKDYGTALQILTKVRETLKDVSVFINLAHTYCEIKQYSRAIENYEAALAKEGRARDATILACLGRVWLLRGKQEKSIQAMKTSLEYSQRALEVNPEQIHFKFNVAFVQIQIAQLIHTLPESQRTLAEVEAAATGLDEAIESFSAIARSPNPPFPKNDIEQRANMGRNTMRRQLERAIQSQREYEEKNAEKLKHARELREAEIRKREEEKRKAEEAAAEKKRKIMEEQQRLRERDREIMEKRQLEEQRRREFVEEEEHRKSERRSRPKGSKRKKKGETDDSDTEGIDSDGSARPRRRSARPSGTPGQESEDRPRQKKRKLERKSKSKNTSKFKSDELIVDSDDEGDADAPASGRGRSESGDEEIAAAPRARKVRIVDEDDEEDEDMGGAPAQNGDADVAMGEEDEDE